MRFSTTTLSLATALFINGAVAGAGAMISVCVYFSTKPFTPVQVQWNTCGSASHCMYCSGQSPSVTVTTAGLSCTAIGKVESKSSSSHGDVCATDKSYWELSYDAGVYSGGCVSRWIGGGSSHNYIEFVDGKYSPGTSVCGSQAACPGTQTDWDAGTAPNIYYVFRPEQKGSGMLTLQSFDDDVLQAVEQQL